MPTIDEEFNAEYSTKGLQPSVGSVQPTRNVSKSFRNTTGAGLQATGIGSSMGGKSMQVTGKALSRTGTAGMRAGAALSRTGVGAIVGVPLMAAGASVAVTGKATQLAGKNLDRTGKKMASSGRRLKQKNKIASSVKDIPKTIKETRALLTAIGWGMGIWFTFQLPLALISLFFLGLTYFIKDVAPGVLRETVKIGTLGLSETAVGKFVGEVAGSAVRSVSWLAEQVFGASLSDIIGAADPETYFVATHFLVYFIGLGTLFLVGLMFLFNGNNSLGGKAASSKVGCFILALFMYALPIVNIVPWFIFWALVVVKNPE